MYKYSLQPSLVAMVLRIAIMPHEWNCPGEWRWNPKFTQTHDRACDEQVSGPHRSSSELLKAPSMHGNYKRDCEGFQG
jgi:hypothetical protein